MGPRYTGPGETSGRSARRNKKRSKIQEIGMTIPQGRSVRSELIGFERTKKIADPAIEPVRGKVGQCRLCGKRSLLTSSHVLPRAVGNSGPWFAHSYTTFLGGHQNNFTRRRFPNGIEFFTTCSDCNNSIGSLEDKSVLEFYQTIEGVLNSPLRLPPTLIIKTKLNRLFRAIIFHLSTANDKSPDAALDNVAKKLRLNELHITKARLYFFAWPYIGDKHVIVRDFAWTNMKDHYGGYAHVLKLAPLGFAVGDTPKFKGMTSLNPYLTATDDEYVEIPFDLFRKESDDAWPAVPSDWEAILRGDSMGMISQRN